MVKKGIGSEMVEQIDIEVKPKTWLNYKDYNIFVLLIAPFRIYFKQFLKFFLVAIIPELLIFGLFYVVDIRLEYDFIIRRFTNLSIDFLDENAARYLIPMILVAIFMLILRSSIVTNIAWKTADKSKANVFWAMDLAFKRIKEIFLASFIFIIFMLIPGTLFILGVLLELRMPGFSWLLIGFALGIPLLIGSRISLFVVGINRDLLPVGTAFQKSWYLTEKANWIKSLLVLFIYVILGIAMPWILTNYLINLYGDWVGIIMIFVRAILYPLFDISLTLTYLNIDANSLNNAIFKDDIIKQREMSEKLIKTKQTGEVK
ncbi:MAG TPA: hypothetical protein VMX55_12175 [candidate division Zixibacteria bacterium]|nr:hypothetical protein [candidate division Zixibacteria bacterium]